VRNKSSVSQTLDAFNVSKANYFLTQVQGREQCILLGIVVDIVFVFQNFRKMFFLVYEVYNLNNCE
jgi:hypothetical protein